MTAFEPGQRLLNGLHICRSVWKFWPADHDHRQGKRVLPEFLVTRMSTDLSPSSCSSSASVNGPRAVMTSTCGGSSSRAGAATLRNT